MTASSSRLPSYGRVPENFDDVRSRLRERPFWRAASLTSENRELRAALASPRADLAFVGSSPAACRVLQAIQAFGRMTGALLVTGEPGVGKRLVAELVHRAGAQGASPFVSVSCAALPADLLEAEIFGAPPRGTAAGRLGRLELASGGTLFLDEIALLPLELQPRVLALVKEGPDSPKVPSAARVRFMASTSRDLRGLAGDRLFNRELAARLSTMVLRVPPLRERQADILPIAAYLLERIAPRRPDTPFRPDEDARRALLRYAWPGNVRELERVLQRALQRCTTPRITLDDLPAVVAAAAGPVNAPGGLSGTPLREVERLALCETLEACGGNGAEAARRLGISKKGMYIKMKRFGLAPSRPDPQA